MISGQVDRRLTEYVMTQIKASANLDRWPNPAGWLITFIPTRCGLRISSALGLGFDCLLHDDLRYFRTKMRARGSPSVPTDEELEAAIRDQQRRVLDQWQEETTCLFLPERANVSGNLPLADGIYRRMLGRWLQTCETRDEFGRPVHLTRHQWRHTLACRLKVSGVVSTASFSSSYERRLPAEQRDALQQFRSHRSMSILLT